MKPGATSHFSWRNNNMSVYKAFEHQHVPEIKQSLKQLQNSFDADIDFIPYRGDFPRGIFTTIVVKTKVALEEIVRMYEEYYAKDSFTHIVEKNIDLKQVVNTNKCYKEGLATMTLKGIDGAKEIQTMMTNFRENPPKELGGFQVLAVRDYKADVRQDLVSGEKSATGLPSSNVLYYELENNAWCCVRPSGTEPKIKFYFGVKGTSLEDAAEKLEKLKNAMVTA